MTRHDPLRRRLLRGGLATAAGFGLSGCKVFDDLADLDHPGRRVMESTTILNFRLQRALMHPGALAPEYAPSDIRQGMRPNGTVAPEDVEYRALEAGGFADYRLDVDGLVGRPLSLDLRTLRAMPARTQITRHDCVEGWSCIARWTGVPLAAVLDLAEPAPAARYAVFWCYDTLPSFPEGPQRYYETIDMVDAYHPQTILAYGLNRANLPEPNGAPLRLRVERQLGYKMAKYLRRIELVASFDDIAGGRGGFWEDQGYPWYAGI
jgi:DMSO/TMAO reductase YedYZ molybdopterin-dependent catalytic subunit